MGETELLANYIAGAKYEDLPAKVVEHTKNLVSDTIACGLGGRRTREGDVLIDVMKEIGGKPECTVFGDNTRLTFMQAAQVNRVLANMLDYDDAPIKVMMGHLSSVLVPVALAVGEHVNATGKEIINALVAGYEVIIRVREAANPSEQAFFKTFERVDSGAAFGAAAVTGRLLGLDGGQMADALGLTGRVRTWRVKHPDPDQPRGGMSRWMKITGGDQVVPGINAALLAKRGFPGERRIFDAGYGYETSVGSDRYDPSKVVAYLGDNHGVMSNGFKFFAACRATSSTLEAAGGVVAEHNIKPEDVDRVMIRVSKEMCHVFPVYEPEHMIQAQFSLPYTVTMVVMGEPTGPNWYTPDKLTNPKLREFQHKVKLVEDPEATEAARWDRPNPRLMSTVEIVLHNGHSFSKRVDYPRGEPENPFTRQDHINKLSNMAGWLGMEKAQINRLLQTLDRLEDMKSVTELTHWLAMTPS